MENKKEHVLEKIRNRLGLVGWRELNSVGTTELFLICSLFLFFIGFLAFDLVTDYESAASLSHLLIDYSLGVAVLFGLFLVVSRLVRLLLKSRKIQETSTLEVEALTNRNSKLSLDISGRINSQFIEWRLTEAEKEVALLLVKGLSLKEVAQVRGTTEKTTRHQSVSIYSKSGLGGRNELSASFLEDFMGSS